MCERLGQWWRDRCRLLAFTWSAWELLAGARRLVRLALETRAYRPFSESAVGTDWWCTGFIDQQREATDMKIVVIGGTGRIGSKVIKNLRERGHNAVAADLNTGINTITGEGLDSALADAQVVVDLVNSLSFDNAAVREFSQTLGRNLPEGEVN